MFPFDCIVSIRKIKKSSALLVILCLLKWVSVVKEGRIQSYSNKSLLAGVRCGEGEQ